MCNTFFNLLRCVETEEEEAVTPCSLALLRVQMGKALRRMTQNGAQLLLVGIRQHQLILYVVRKTFNPPQAVLQQFIILL